MKKTMIAMAVIALTATSAYAGVRKIVNNGMISGVPSYTAYCTNGETQVLYKKNGTWYQGGRGHMGNRYNSWSRDEVAAFLCK